VIENFPLTDSNYINCVTLVKDRFGQSYKLANAHMDTLMNLPRPVNSLSSLQTFHDKLKSHMRALASLGQPPESSVFTQMVMGKLPTEFKKQFARDHNTGNWTIHELMSFILKEIRVLEVGHYTQIAFLRSFNPQLHPFIQQLGNQGSSSRRRSWSAHTVRDHTLLTSA